MTDKEAMKLALFALDIVKIHYTQNRHINEAITALKKQLADYAMREVQMLGQEIEQEPVGMVKDLFTSTAWEKLDVRGSTKVYLDIPPQRTEQNPMPDEMLQAITDPENQPSQYGTVTLDYHFEKIKKWEDLFERMSNKVLAQPEQEPVAWLLTDKKINSLQVDSIQRLINRLNHAHHTDLCVRINGQDEWFQADWLKHMVRATPPQRKPLTEEQIFALENSIPDEVVSDRDWCIHFARAIEAKIKENT